MTADAELAAGLQALAGPLYRQSVLCSDAFPLIGRQLELPISLNGVRTQAVIKAQLQIAETYSPRYELTAPSATLRVAIKADSAVVCELKQGDQVMVLGRKKMGSGREAVWQLQVLLWLDVPMEQAGWVSELAVSAVKGKPGKLQFSPSSKVCAHFLRRPGLRRGWFLRKLGPAGKWRRVWCQCTTAVQPNGSDASHGVDGEPVKLHFFDSNNA